MSKTIRCQVPNCEETFEAKSGYISHLRAHIRNGDISPEQYEKLKKATGEKQILYKKDIRQMKADVRRWRRIARQRERDLDFVDRVTAVVRDSLETISVVEPPKISAPSEGVKDEVPVLLLSDCHVGKKTDSYDHEVFKERLTQLMVSLQSIVEIHRNVRPLKKIVVVLNGDIIDAESIYPSQSVEGVSAHILDQIYTHGIPEFVRFFEFLLGLFEEVEVHAVRGNHGKLNPSKWTSAKSTNWDLVFYRSLETALRNQDRIDWNIYQDDWKAMFQVFGWGVLATHGDMIRMYYNTPTYGISRQATRWQATYRNEMQLHYFLFGHFHTLILRERFNQVVYTVNGSFVTDDEYAEENMGVGSVPEQALFAIHPDWGWAWSYPLQLGGEGYDAFT